MATRRHGVRPPDKDRSTALGESELHPAGLAIHDGRVHGAELGASLKHGSLVLMATDVTDIKEIVPRSDGYLPDDLVFDDKGRSYSRNVLLRRSSAVIRQAG